MNGAAPALSVIIASAAPLREVPASLSAVAGQARGRSVEMILAHSSDEPWPATLADAYPDVVRVRLPRGANLPRVLGEAIGHAKGAVIAITSATSLVGERWIAELERAHRGPSPVIGGAVEPAGLQSLTDWAAYFCDYGQFMRPAEEGAVGELPGSNISFKRWVLAHGAGYVAPEFWKTYWTRRIRAEGLALSFVPSILVYYRQSHRLRSYLVHRFHNGRCFAGMRLAELSAARRAWHLATAPALPLVFAARLLRTAGRKRRYLGRFAVALPVACLAIAAWSLGELCGYLAGARGSCAHVS